MPYGWSIGTLPNDDLVKAKVIFAKKDIFKNDLITLGRESDVWGRKPHEPDRKPYTGKYDKAQ